MIAHVPLFVICFLSFSTPGLLLLGVGPGAVFTVNVVDLIKKPLSRKVKYMGRGQGEPVNSRWKTSSLCLFWENCLELLNWSPWAWFKPLTGFVTNTLILIAWPTVYYTQLLSFDDSWLEWSWQGLFVKPKMQIYLLLEKKKKTCELRLGDSLVTVRKWLCPCVVSMKF